MAVPSTTAEASEIVDTDTSRWIVLRPWFVVALLAAVVTLTFVLTDNSATSANRSIRLISSTIPWRRGSSSTSFLQHG